MSRSDADSSGKVRYLNRDLSWVAFNARVLALAEDRSRPMLERLKFLAIVSSNFDEFFQVRVAGLKEQLVTGVVVLSPDGLAPGAARGHPCLCGRSRRAADAGAAPGDPAGAGRGGG